MIMTTFFFSSERIFSLCSKQFHIKRTVIKFIFKHIFKENLKNLELFVFFSYSLIVILSLKSGVSRDTVPVGIYEKLCKKKALASHAHSHPPPPPPQLKLSKQIHKMPQASKGKTKF